MSPESTTVTPDDRPADAQTPADSDDRRSSSWDIKNAPKNYLWLVIFQIGSAFFSFASVWLITRYLGPEGYGSVIAIIAASQIAQVFVNWTSTAIVKFGVDEFSDTHRIARTFWARSAIFLPNLLAVLLLSPIWLPNLSSYLSVPQAISQLVLLHLAASVFLLHVQQCLQAVKLMRLYGAFLLLEKLVGFVLILVLIGVGRLSNEGALLSFAIPPAILGIAGLIVLAKYLRGKIDFSSNSIVDLARFSFPLLPYFALGLFATNYIDAIFISQFLSVERLGVYALAVQINGLTLQLPTVANYLLLPFMVTSIKENDLSRIDSYFSHAIPVLTIIWGLFCTTMAFVGYYALPMIFGPSFYDSTVPLWILVATSCANLPVLIGYGALANAESKTYIAMIAAVFMAAVNIIGNLILIPLYGIEGCAWSTSGMYLVTTLTFAVLLQKGSVLGKLLTFFAMVPGIAGAATIFAIRSPTSALGICFLISIIVVAVGRKSFGKTLSIFNRIRYA